MFQLQRMNSLKRKRRSAPMQHAICDDALCAETQKYRDKMDHYLDCIGKHWDMNLRIDHRGICSFQRGRFVVVIEVPKESSSFFVYTCLLKCSATATSVMRKALELNYLNQSTCGCTIALDPTCEDDTKLEVTLCYTQSIMGLNRWELCDIVMNFLATAEKLRRQLETTERSSSQGSKRQVVRRIASVRRPSRECRPPPPPQETKAKDAAPSERQLVHRMSSLRHPTREYGLPRPPPEETAKVDADSTPVISNKKPDNKMPAEIPPAKNFDEASTPVMSKKTIGNANALQSRPQLKSFRSLKTFAPVISFNNKSIQYSKLHLETPVTKQTIDGGDIKAPVLKRDTSNSRPRLRSIPSVKNFSKMSSGARGLAGMTTNYSTNQGTTNEGAKKKQPSIGVFRRFNRMASRSFSRSTPRPFPIHEIVISATMCEI